MIFDSLLTLSPASFAILLATLLMTIVYFALKRRDLPPGPVGLPFIGYWPFMNNTNCHQILDDLKKKHGDVFCFTCTGTLYINLGSIKALREAHITKSECFGERFTDFTLMKYMFEKGVAFINGEAWKVQRKFFIQVLKERGSISMKNDIAGALYDSIKSTIDDLKAKKGEPVNLVELLTHKCNTNLRVAMFGETGISEEKLQTMVELYGEEVASTTAMNVLLIGKIAKYLIFPLKPEYYKTLKNQKKLKSMLFGVVNEHKATYDEENTRDVIDEYFKERDTRRSKGDPTAEYFTDESLVESLILFVGDGVLSIAAFVSSMLTHLIDNPEEQEKVYKEIVDVVGLDRQPSIEDKSNLTYLNAFILESLRATNMFPFFPSLQCTKETTLNGYRIPKGAITLVNFYSIHNDPEVYEEPKKFNPSRYIQTAGKQRAELPVPFGVGKRACLGESFTMMQIFLFVATIVQNFRLSLPEGTKSTSYEIFLSGKLSICAHLRNQS